MADRLRQARSRRSQLPIIVHVPAPAPVEALAPPAKQSRWMEITSLIVAVGAAAFTGATFWNQAGVNAITEQRYERRYADRINWWDSHQSVKGQIVLTVVVENRSPGRARKVMISGSSLEPGPTVTPSNGGPEFVGTLKPVRHFIGDIAPCSSVTVEFPGQTFGALADMVSFQDGQGRYWNKDKNGFLTASSVDKYRTAFSEIVGDSTAGGWLKPGTTSSIDDCTDS